LTWVSLEKGGRGNLALWEESPQRRGKKDCFSFWAAQEKRGKKRIIIVPTEASQGGKGKESKTCSLVQYQRLKGSRVKKSFPFG